MAISIVTISFNQAQFLEQAIHSVLDQDFKDVEYIVVDPGSTDGSREIIRKYHSQITTVILDPDKGPADGLNNGFARAGGEILGFLNSDDLLLPGALATATRYLASHPQVDVASGHAFVIDETGRRLRDCYSDRFNLIAYAYGQAQLVQPSTFFRRSCFTRTSGFNVYNRSNWDGEVFVEMALAGARFGLIPAFMSAYRTHADSITGSGSHDQLIRLHNARMFRKIIGRDSCSRDRLLAQALRLVKHVREPRNVYQRLTRGPIYCNAKNRV